MKHQFPSFEEKRAHEKYVAEKVIELQYPKFAFKQFGNDHGEPDVIFQKGDTTLGIEITTAYWEDIQAEMQTVADQDKEMCALIQQRVMDKATRKYEGVDRIVLCIEANDPASDEIAMLSCLLDTPIPPHHPFDYIYVLSYTAAGGEYELFTLYPKEN